MLFGSKSLRSEFVEDIQVFCAKENLQPIFAGVLSSVAKGLQTEESDIDARALYVHKENSHKIYMPTEYEEKELRKRFYPEQVKTYDYIGLWEYSSYFQFLATPSFSGDFSVGLYHNVPSLLYTPYSWDPYGIVQKIDPFVRDCYNPLYMTQSCMNEFFRFYHGNVVDFFHKKKEKANFDANSTSLPTAYYFKAIYEMIAIDWMLEHNTFHPWYFKTLLPVVKKEVADEILALIAWNQERRHAIFQENQGKDRVELLEHLLCEKNPLITEYFQTVQDKLEKRRDIRDFKQKSQVQENVNYIHEIIDYSIHHEIQINETV